MRHIPVKPAPKAELTQAFDMQPVQAPSIWGSKPKSTRGKASPKVYRLNPVLTMIRLAYSMENALTPLSPEIWLRDLFTSKAVRDGMVIRRKARDIERFAGWGPFRAELKRRGFRAVENSGQIVIFCNSAPVRPLKL